MFSLEVLPKPLRQGIKACNIAKRTAKSLLGLGVFRITTSKNHVYTAEVTFVKKCN